MPPTTTTATPRHMPRAGTTTHRAMSTTTPTNRTCTLATPTRPPLTRPFTLEHRHREVPDRKMVQGVGGGWALGRGFQTEERGLQRRFQAADWLVARAMLGCVWVGPYLSPAAQQMQPTQTLQPPQPSGGRRRRVVDEDPDERRRKFLERNRAAATRCRQKRKVWVMSLEKKAEELTQTNMQLQNEVTMLKNEVTQLKQLLLTHKDCPITAMQKESQGYLSLNVVWREAFRFGPSLLAHPLAQPTHPPTQNPSCPSFKHNTGLSWDQLSHSWSGTAALVFEAKGLFLEQRLRSIASPLFKRHDITGAPSDLDVSGEQPGRKSHPRMYPAAGHPTQHHQHLHHASRRQRCARPAQPPHGHQPYPLETAQAQKGVAPAQRPLAVSSFRILSRESSDAWNATLSTVCIFIDSFKLICILRFIRVSILL
ncbi:hypothetical protein JZ751_009696 [Albula glossodonta]|uniref:BZIP domain-containing protein n=1 Tax=Albula glossodonta TaxID=121402 RepID=A0A8T2NW21_9TELE|nr:hypothetical protein JZ751_009696 [Albula glossodonta]